MTALLISRYLHSQLSTQMAANPDKETCGLLVGCKSYVAPCCGQRAPTRVHAVHPITNTHPDPHHRYQMDPTEQLAVYFAAEQADQQVVAVWHTHLGDLPHPSPADIENAHDPDIFHLIGTIVGDTLTSMNLWHIIDGHPTRQTLVVD